MPGPWVRRLLAIICIAVFLPTGASAGPFEEAAYFLKIEPFRVPIKMSNGLTRNGYITIVMAAQNKKRAKRACAYLPRIRESMIQVFLDRPIPVRNKHMDFSDIQQPLLQAVQKAVGGKTVAGMLLLEGVADLSKGETARKIPHKPKSCNHRL